MNYIFALVVFLISSRTVMGQSSTLSASLIDNIELQKFIIAKDFFSSILGAQTAIFSIIIAVFLVANYLYQTHYNSQEIKKEVESQIKIIKEALHTEFLEEQKVFIEKINKRLDEGDSNINILRGEVFRQMATFWDSQKIFSTAFIWWVRAGYYTSLAQDDIMTRSHLRSARSSVEKVNYWDLDPKFMSEIEDMLSKFDKSLYKIEVDTLYDAIKAAFTKKIPV